MSELSVAEIRRRYVQRREPVSAQLLGRLRRDRRHGVQRIYAQLRRRQEREREERLRLDGMLNFERVLWKSGVTRIAGVDEAGVGPMAGPVFAAAVVFEPETRLEGIDDSKRLDPRRREALAAQIEETAVDWAVARAEVSEIDRLNVYHAAMLAMGRAVEGLAPPPQHVLLDAREIPRLDVPQNRFDKGDGINFSIAAASILAKTHRDRCMAELDRLYPEYGFSRHKGYCTSQHQSAVRRHGPCAAHRMSFQFIRELCGEFSQLFYELRDRLGSVAARDELTAFEELLRERRPELADEEYRKMRLMVSRRWKAV